MRKLMRASKKINNSSSSPKVQKIINEAIALIKSNKKEDAHQFLQQKIASATKKDKISIFYAIHALFKKMNPTHAASALDSVRAIDPKLTLPLLLQASFFEEQRKKDKAIETLKEMIGLDPTNNELVEGARILSRYGEQALAVASAKKAYFASEEDLLISTYPLRIALQNADWDFAEKITNKMSAVYRDNKYALVNETPRTHLLWCDDEAVNFEVIKNFARNKFKKVAKDPLASVPEDDFKKRKVRIGYVSNDFRDHPTSYLAMGMLRHHNKYRFDIIIYDTSYDDGHAMRRQVFSKANIVKDISKLSDAAAASVIHKDKIDVLVDLNGLTEGTRLGIFAFRPAPVQMSYLGFPGTTGTPFVDYIIADDYTLPISSEKFNTESIIRIPNTYQINDYIAQYLPPKPPFNQLGIPDGKLIIGMFNNVNKVGREVWRTWMRIMQASPEAVLWMLDPGDLARKNLMDAASLEGVDVNRFFWAKKLRVDDHLARIAHCSIALDPWPYGGHTTTSDALFAGVPVIALEGTNFPSRVSGGLLNATGLKSLVAKDKDEYVRLAARLLNDTQLLLNIKSHLDRNRKTHPVFDAVGRTLQIEGAYLHACDVATKNIKPVSFNINNRVAKNKGSSNDKIT
jgi:predicted O-linked N-acetylglucosamine transferase (SPINDLY family)